MNIYFSKNALYFSIILFLTVYQSEGQNPWELEKDKNGIAVFTRIEKGSEFKAFKAITTIDAPVKEILKVLKHADDYTKWYGYTKVSKRIRQEQQVQYNYVETIFPWPFRNRDMVYKMTINQSDSTAIKISLLGIPDYLPEKKGIVRMKKAAGHILLLPIGDKTEVRYLFHSEPGDNIPVWLANNSIAELPFKTLLGLKNIVKETDDAQR